MARRLSKVGTNSGNNGCPTLYQLPGTDEYVVQGDRVTDPAELGQLENLTEGEGAVVVPRELLANFGPKEPVHVPCFIAFDEFDGMFTTLKHSAWRLETRRRYAWDEQQDTYRQFLAAASTRTSMTRGVASGASRLRSGSGSNGCGSSTSRRRPASSTSSTTDGGTRRPGRTSGSCPAPGRKRCGCRRQTSGSSMRGWSLCSTSTRTTR